MLKAGDVAPEFSVKDFEGRAWTKKQLEGRNAVLWFFPKADTPG